MHLREVQKNSTAPFGSIGWMFHRRYFYGMVACEVSKHARSEFQQLISLSN
ncbi:hypothetical protein Plhal304r1_c009g0035831 [Plasmopara halstedii]